VICSFSIIPFVYGTEFAFDDTLINLTWFAVPNNPIYLDLDKDGAIDCIYRWAFSGSNYTLIRYLGDSCVSSASVSITGVSNELIKIYDNEVWFGRTDANTGYVSKINVLNGLGSPNIHSLTLDRNHNFILFNYIKNDWNTPTIFIAGSSHSIVLCSPTGDDSCGDLEVSNSTTTLTDQACNSGPDQSGAGTTTANLGYATVTLTAPCSLSATYNSAHVATTENAPYNNGSWCITTTCLNGLVFTGATFGNFLISDTVKLYANGIELESDDYETVGFVARQTFFKDYFELNSDYEKFLKLHYKILDPTLTSPVPFALYNSSGTLRIVNLGALDKITASTINNFDDKAWDYFVNDLWSAPTFTTKESNTALTNYPITLNDGSTVYNNVVTYGSFVIATPYKVQPDSGTTSRQLVTRYTNSHDVVPVFIGPTTTLTTLTILIQNAPTDYAVIIKDSAILNGDNYVWSMQPLTADHNVSIDLPTGKCITVIGTTIATLPFEVNNFGTLCASGTMPKTLVYSENLSFVFWSLPYGVAHTFNSDTDILTTKVRHDTTPYNYTIRIFDANNVLQYEQEFLSTNSTIQTETHNATGITFPALLKVYDDNGNQIYYSTIGIPGYLSASVAWFSQWLTISGFNLLFMLPLVFGAMFTRNTVGIGTMISVVFIATLTWLGILPIPDVAIWFMFIVAAIGIVAYKKLYD
jgi:hypothetical protein